MKRAPIPCKPPVLGMCLWAYVGAFCQKQSHSRALLRILETGASAWAIELKPITR